MPDEQLAAWANGADALYGADSGAQRLIGLGFSPVVVGDFDSFDPATAPPGTRLVHDPDPDRTDCDKLLALVRSDGHEAVTLACVEGDLLDHTLATLSSLARSGLDGRLALRSGLAWLVRPGPGVRVEEAFGARVSLIPLVRCIGVSLRGVVWGLEEAVIEPGGALSVSNEGTGTVEASLRTGAAYLFVCGPSWTRPTW